MGFLIRSAFWFSLVLLALPLDTGENGERSVGALQALSAARAAIGDLSAICERKPDVCETGRSAMHTVGLRAREAARIAYQMLDEHLDEPAKGKAPPAELTDTQTLTGGIEAIIRESDVPQPKG